MRNEMALKGTIQMQLNFIKKIMIFIIKEVCSITIQYYKNAAKMGNKNAEKNLNRINQNNYLFIAYYY